MAKYTFANQFDTVCSDLFDLLASAESEEALATVAH